MSDERREAKRNKAVKGRNVMNNGQNYVAILNSNSKTFTSHIFLLDIRDIYSALFLLI